MKIAFFLHFLAIEPRFVRMGRSGQVEVIVVVATQHFDARAMYLVDIHAM